MARNARSPNGPAVHYVFKPHARTAQHLRQRLRRAIRCVEHPITEWTCNDQVSRKMRDSAADHVADETRHIDRGQHRISRRGEDQIAVQRSCLFIDLDVRLETWFGGVCGSVVSLVM